MPNRAETISDRVIAFAHLGGSISQGQPENKAAVGLLPYTDCVFRAQVGIDFPYAIAPPPPAGTLTGFGD